MKRRLKVAGKDHPAPSTKTQFKLRPKSFPKGTLITGALWLLFTIGLYLFGPPEIPFAAQKILGLVHASLGALAGWFGVREFLKNRHHAHHHHAEDSHGDSALMRPESLEKKAALASALSTLHVPATAQAVADPPKHPAAHPHDHAHLLQFGTGRTKRRYANITAGVLFAILFGWWWTPLAPIDRSYVDANLETDLREAAATVWLTLVDPHIAVVEVPLIPLKTEQDAKKMRPGGAPYRQGLIALAQRDFEKARTQFNNEISTKGEQASVAELALLQTELFAGNFPVAVKKSEELLKTQKNDPILQTYLTIALLHTGQFPKALAQAKTLYDQAKSGTPAGKLTAINLLLAVYIQQGRWDELLRLEKAANSLNYDESTPILAALKNNLGVLHLLASPPDTAGAQILLSRSQDIIRTVLDTDSATSRRGAYLAIPLQNRAILHWQLAQTNSAFADLEQAAALRGHLPTSHPAHASSQLQRQFLANCGGITADYPAAQLQYKPLLAQFTKTDTRALAAQLLHSRYLFARGMYLAAELKLQEFLAAGQARFLSHHPAMIEAQLLLAESILERANGGDLQKTSEDVLKTLAPPLAILAERGRELHPLKLWALGLQARALALVGKEKEGLEGLRQGLEMAQNSLANVEKSGNYPLHPAVAKLLATRALVSLGPNPGKTQCDGALKDYQAGLELYLAAMESETADQPLACAMLLGIARTQLLAKQPSAALTVLRRWEAESLPALPENHPHAADGLELLSQALKSSNQSAAAGEYEQRAKSIRAALQKS
ncbi:MAG: hypothetical protein SFX18_06400 [Pirellulales bacterium]|nr:hypothetical protein [Pirellulales bacterium]